MNIPSPTTSPNSSQQGSVVVIFAISIVMLIALLGSIQIGYTAYQKRELQKVADMAALSGVQEISEGDDFACNEASTLARHIAQQNASKLNSLNLSEMISPLCGRWAIPTDYTSDSEEALPSLFNEGQRPYNALQVNVEASPSLSLLPFLGNGGPSSATATAVYSEPVAAFSVGSRLLSVRKEGLIGSLLSTVGLSPEHLTVLDSDGLADASISAAGLLKALGLPPTAALGLGTPEELLKLEQLSLGDILQATVVALSQSNVAHTDVGLLNEAIQALLKVNKLDVPIKLFGDGGLVAIAKTADPAAALSAQINVADLVGASLLVANGSNLINLPLNNVLFAIEGKVQVVEPPSIGIGPAGTVAHSAQIRVYLRAYTDDVPVAGPLLSTTGTYVDIPIIIEIASSKGTLSNVCSPPLNKNQATIDINSTAANLCVGKFQAMDADGNEFFSATNSCYDAAMDPNSEALARYKVLNILDILPVTSRVALPLLPIPETVSIKLTAPESNNSTATVQNGALDLFETANAAADAILGGLLGDLLGPNPGYSTNDETRTKLAEELVLRDNGGSRPISTVVNELQWSREALDTLGTRMASNGLTGVIGGTLQVVGNTLNTLLGAPLADLGCTLAGLGGQRALNRCRVDAVKTLTLAGDNFVAGLASIAIALLQPLLDPLSQVLQQLLNMLGLNLGETDVTLHSVQCGVPHLVQ